MKSLPPSAVYPVWVSGGHFILTLLRDPRGQTLNQQGLSVIVMEVNRKKVHISIKVDPIISAHISLTNTVIGPSLSSRRWKGKTYVSSKHANILKQH